MALKLFTDTEVEILRINQYTYNVTNRSIKFTTEFKQLFYDKIQEGLHPRKIIEELGYDINILGIKRSYGIALHIKEEHRINGEFHEGRMTSTIEQRLSKNEISPSKALIQMNTRVTFLEQQIEYLKKILQEVK
ncbi:MAG: HTH domain-containing protein [Candidatus Izemoplasmatales bacterium]